jgi:hypothetical protein
MESQSQEQIDRILAEARGASEVESQSQEQITRIIDEARTAITDIQRRDREAFRLARVQAAEDAMRRAKNEQLRLNLAKAMAPSSPEPLRPFACFRPSQLPYLCRQIVGLPNDGEGRQVASPCYQCKCGYPLIVNLTKDERENLSRLPRPVASNVPQRATKVTILR